MQFGRTYSLGKIFGIDIRIDLSWVIIFVLVTWTFAFGYFPVITPELSSSQNIVLGLITSFVFFFSVLVHELSHSVVANRNGLPVNLITLFIFGGASHLEEDPKTPWVEFKMAFAGPLSSLILGFVFFTASTFFISNSGLFAMLQVLGVVNITLGIFNLLPGFPLDGGRVFRALVWHFNDDYLRATRIAVYGGQLVSLGLVAWGAYSIVTSLVVGGIWLVVIGLFLYSLAGISYKQTESKERLSHIKVKDFLKDNYALVAPETKISNIFEEFKKKKTDTVFMGRNNKVQGFVRLDDVEDISGYDTNDKNVASVSHMLKDDEKIFPEDTALKAIKSMQKEDISSILVEENNVIKGVIYKNEIIAFLRNK